MGYARFYSLGRLRVLAERRRGTAHVDLYESLKVLFMQLREGHPPLGIPGLGSFLFSDQSTPDLDDARLINQDLLDAIRNLCFTEDTGPQAKQTHRPTLQRSRLAEAHPPPHELIHDSPRKADLEPHIDARLFLFVHSSTNRFKGGEPSFQSIVATTPPPPSDLNVEPFVCLRLDARSADGLLLKRSFRSQT